MAVPVYSTDLQDIALAESGETWGEPTNATAGGVPSAETDYFIQQAACFSKTCAVAGGGLCGMGTQAATAKTITSPNAIFTWLFFGCPNTLDIEANGGMRIIAGQTSANYYAWYVRGKDTYPYGGWLCIPVDPNVASQATVGTPNGTWQYFGAIMSTLATVSKGSPFGTDVIRFGRTLQVVSGSPADGYATFAGAAAKNDANDATNGYNRWGLFQAIDGGYLQQGLFLMGTAGTLVNFKDSNATITIANTKRVTSTFNTFEIRNASSRVDWSNLTITALGTVSRGNFVVTDNATVNLTGCALNNMGTFTFQSNTTINQCTFRSCKLITQGGALITNCRVETTAETGKALLCNNPAQIQYCTFVSPGTGHAIEISSTGQYALNGNTFTGYGANGTTNAAIYNNSGGNVILDVTNGATPTVYNGLNATTTVNSNVSVTLTGLKNPTEVRVFTNGTTTEVAGQETITTGSFTFGVASGAAVDIAILSLGYQNIRLLSYSTTSNATIPISQQIDRQYSP